MIPLNTPPGTEIVAIEDHEHARVRGLTIKKGQNFTIISWTDKARLTNGTTEVAVRINHPLAEARIHWNPSRFRLLEVHPSLTALLDAKPVDVKRLLETEGL